MRLPEQHFAAPVLQEHTTAHGLGGQRNLSYAAQSENYAHQQTALPSCSIPTAAIPGAAALQVTAHPFQPPDTTSAAVALAKK